MNIAGFLDVGRKAWNRVYRRVWSGYPSAQSAESNEAWLDRQFRYYSVQQPYTSPLTMVNGNLTGETWEMRQGYRQWSMTEPAAKSALLTKCLAVCQLDSQVLPASSKNPHDKEAARWVDWAVSRSLEGWGGLIFNILFPGCQDGFSVVEKVNGHVEDLGSEYKGRWTHTNYASIDTAYVRFKLDTFRKVVGIQSTIGAQGPYMMDPRDYVIFTHLKIFENPFGVSDMRAAVRACNLIESAIRLRHILLTNYSGPYIVGKAADPSTRQKLMSIMAQARANGWIVVPEGAELEVISLAVANLQTFREAIDDYRQEIVTAIQGAYLQLLEGGIADGRGNTEVHKGIAELFQWWLAQQVCQAVNTQIIPDLIIPNYGYSSGLPTVQLGGIDEDAIGRALDRFKKGQELGLTLSTEQVMEVGGFEAPKDDADKLTPPASSTDMPNQTDPFGGMFSQKGGAGLPAASFRHDYSAAAELLGIAPERLPATPRKPRGRVRC